MELKYIFEIFKSFFLKGIIKKIFSFKSIRDSFVIFACISSIAIFYYSFKLQEYAKTGSEHFRYSDFISSKMKPKIDSVIDELFETSSRNSYFFISLVEVNFNNNYCQYRWKYVRGFNEGSKQSFDEIQKKNPNFREDMAWMCSEWDTKERLTDLANSRINIDVENSTKSLLFTQKQWIDEGKTNYKINYLTFFIKAYTSNSEFYIIQVASKKPLKKIVQSNIFDYKFQSLIEELHKITKPIKWYDIFNR